MADRLFFNIFHHNEKQRKKKPQKPGDRGREIKSEWKGPSRRMKRKQAEREMEMKGGMKRERKKAEKSQNEEKYK